MTTFSWDALGGDPAPGDPGVFDELARSFSETAENAGSAHAKLARFSTSVDAGIWSGEAADGFREKIGELPPRLEKLLHSYAAAAEGMGEYGMILRDLQAEARALLGKAQAAQDEKVSQEKSRDQAQAADPMVSASTYDAAIVDAEGRLASARREIQELRERRVAAERWAIDRLEDAEALGIKNDPWYKRAWDAIDHFIDEHADILRAISSALKTISAIAGLLSFIPFLAPICGPIALIAGGLALLTDAALVATGNGDWKALLVDVALMALPGAGKLLRSAMKGTRVGAAAGRTMKEVKGINEAIRTGTSGSSVVRVPNFASNQAAFRHYAKHVKGVELGKMGTAKARKPDMSEISSFKAYVAKARSLLSGDAPEGVLQGIRRHANPKLDGDLVRLDPKSGYFGVRSPEGTIRTFFRPDRPMEYFQNQFSPSP